MAKKKVSISIREETKLDLLELKSAMERVSLVQGKKKKFTYDDAINFLYDYFIIYDPPSEEEKKEEYGKILEDLTETLKQKKEMTELIALAPCTPFSYAQIKRNFFFVPDSLLEEINSLAQKKKTSTVTVFLTALKTGIDLQKKFFVALDEQDSEQVHEKLNQLPPQMREEIYRALKKKLKSDFLQLFKKFSKKAKKRTP